MRKASLFLIALVFFAFLGATWWYSAGGTLPATGGAPIGPPAQPNTTGLEARQQSAAGQAAYYTTQAAALAAAESATLSAHAAQLAAATQAAAGEQARATEASARATAEVALRMTEAAWRVTVEAAAAASTSTAQALATADLRTQAAADLQATAAAADVNAFSTAQAQKNESNEVELRKQQTAADVAYQLRYWPAFVFVVLVVLSAVFLAWWFKMRDDVNAMPVHRDLHGNLEGVIKGGKVIAMGNMTGAVIDPRQPAPLGPTPEQLSVTTRNQEVEAMRALSRPGSPTRAASAAARPAQLPAEPPAPALGAGLPVTVPWTAVMATWPGKRLALGMGEGGRMITVDPYNDAAPHLLMAGTTGSGKTHYGLHVITTQALALGWQAVILDRSGVGMTLFAGHANARLVVLDRAEQAAGYLEAAYGEIVSREKQLAGAGYYDWNQWGSQPPAPRTLIVMDEFSNLADELKAPERESLWRWARMIAAQGRKSGILLALALQDPTHRSIDLRIRRMMTPVVFPLQGRDAYQLMGFDGSRGLSVGHFLTRLAGAAREGAAISGSADDFQRFLLAHPAPALPEPEWLLRAAEDASAPLVIDVPAPLPAAAPAVDPNVARLAEAIEPEWVRGASKRACARAAGLVYAGGAAARIDAAISYLVAKHAAATAATATTTPENGPEAPVPAGSSSSSTPILKPTEA